MVTKRKKNDKDPLDMLRGQLNTERIIQESINLLNKEGIIQLTMRKLADNLGIRAASLYYHIKDKSELLQLIAEDICNKIQIPDPLLPWHEQLLHIMSEYRSVLMSVRDSAEILLETAPFTPKRLYLIDTIYRIFLEAGLPPEEVQMVSASINNYVLCFVMDEMKLLNVATDQGITVEELTSHGNEMFKNLTEDQYPNVVFMSDFISRVDKDREFQYSLEIMIDGIKNRIVSLKSI
jgi:TetR/AcrR family tetracycline transcriptional repressor